MNHRRWNLLPPAPEHCPLAGTGLPRLLVQLLYNRGLTEPSKLAIFLAGDKRLSADPFLLPDMHQAVGRIYQALLSGENMAVYGDFDADGITATAALVQGITALGGKPVPYIPHRLSEGHGLRTAALEGLRREGISLVITVDCGITGLAEVKKARRLGLDIVITDHHVPLDLVPPAFATVDPKLPGSRYPFSDLAGVGVAFKLLQALFQSIGKEDQLGQLMDLVALGSVADMMPLLGENRYLVKEGLKVINASPRLGIKEMIERAGLTSGCIDEGSISWTISPRLNAAGRIAHAMNSYQLLMTDSPEEAAQLATQLEKQNTERQQLTTIYVARAREQVLARGIAPLLVASDSEYPAGISGLVASRLTEEFYRPTMVVKTGVKFSTASCRSIPEFDIIAALTRVSHLMTYFGGHPRAAGFTLLTRNLPRLQEAVLEMATTQLSGVDLRPRLDIDAEVTLGDLTNDTYRSVHQLAPFGQGNPLPVFLSRRVQIITCNLMGNNGSHLRMKLKQNGITWDCVGFGMGECLGEVASPLDIVYNLEVDRWRGEERLRLNILDFAPSSKLQ